MAERAVKIKSENAYFDSRPGVVFYAHETYEVPRDLSHEEAERLVGRNMAEDLGDLESKTKDELVHIAEESGIPVSGKEKKAEIAKKIEREA